MKFSSLIAGGGVPLRESMNSPAHTRAHDPRTPPWLLVLTTLSALTPFSRSASRTSARICSEGETTSAYTLCSDLNIDD